MLRFGVRPCGISRDILLDSGMQLLAQLRALFQILCLFHEKNSLRDGRHQSVSALLGDLTFSQTNNRNENSSYNIICAEFGVEPKANFCITHGANQGLGNVFFLGFQIWS